MKLSQATAVVSPVLLLLIVRFIVTTESQPCIFVNVCVGVEDALYVVPYHVKLSQATAVVSPEDEGMTLINIDAFEVQPLIVETRL